VFESQLLGSFCKQIVPLLTEHDDVIETQTKNCTCSQIGHATTLVCPGWGECTWQPSAGKLCWWKYTTWRNGVHFEVDRSLPVLDTGIRTKLKCTVSRIRGRNEWCPYERLELTNPCAFWETSMLMLGTILRFRRVWAATMVLLT